MVAQSNWPALYGTPVIQRRVSIARPPGPPTEPSDVLVLNSRSTSPDPSAVRSKVLYLDLRLSLPVTTPGGLDWTFAGLREIIPPEEEEEDVVRYRWIHTVDSHGSDEPPDEGTMVRVIDEHGEEMEVETGLGLNPETGEMGPYKEVWKEESVPQGMAFAFLMSDPDPDRSTRFLAVVGPHATGLWQGNDEDGCSSVRRDGPPLVHAVRLQRKSDECGSRQDYVTVFSTGYQALEGQLAELVNELMRRGKEGRGLWDRGANIVLGDSRGRGPLTWTVWDAGYVHN